MANPGLTFDEVCELGLAFPGAKEDRYYGNRALKVNGQMFAVRTRHRSAEPNSISVPVGYSSRKKLIAKHPDVFYLKPHYEPYPVVLVRLKSVRRGQLQRLLGAAHRAVSSGAVKPGRRKTTKTSDTRRASKSSIRRK